MAEELANTIEEVADVTSKITGREVGFFVAGAGLGVALGFGVGYFALNKRVEKKRWKEAEEEVARMREHYRKLRIALEGEVQRRRPLEELVVEQGYTQRYTEEEQEAIDKANEDNPPEKEVTNVFVESQEWNYSAEIAQRSKDIPYIIHYDEFRENELEHEQSTITYYEEDDVLADERDIPVNDMDELIGLGNLGRWGHGSNDPNIVYIRNERLEIDMEVIRDQRSYSEVVQGNIRHSSSDRMRRRHRRFDDE